MSDRLEDDRPAKKLKLDEPESAPAAPAVPEPAPNPFSWAGEGGLFASLVDTLGKRASTEPEVGISEYVDPEIPPFSGIIKHRFTDFLVFEVAMDGEVVRLKDIKAPPKPKGPAPAEGAGKTNRGAEGGAAPAESQPLWNDQSETTAKALFSDAKLEEFKAFVLAGATPIVRGAGVNATQPRRIFTTDVIEAKDARTAVHRGLRESFDNKLASETRELTPGGDQVIDVTWAAGGKKPRQSKAEKKAVGGGDLPPYIHFTLQKTNKEMHDALSGLCRTLNIQNRDIGTSGTKDKRAVTIQRVSVKRNGRTIDEVWRAANPSMGGGRGGRGRGRGRGGWSGGTDRGVTIGDLAYSATYLELGKLKGNKFVITLRDVEADSPTTITRAISVLKERGFLNYYGMQRFGTAPIPTHAVGLALLRGDWALATHLLLLERDGEGDDVKLARILWKEGKLEDAVRTMPRRCVAEKAIMEYFVRGDKLDHLKALSKIPKNLRMMYVHAYQSYVWNRVVSARVQLFGCSEPVVGDLVYEDGEIPATEEEPVADVEPVAVVESLDPDLEDDAPSASTPRNAMTSDKAERGSKVAKAKVLTQTDIDSGKYTIRDVILTLPGYAVIYPAGKLGEMYREILASDKLNIDDMFRKQKEYSLGGTYRSLLYTPQDVTHRLLLYTSTAQDLAQSDEDVLKKLPAPETIPFSGEGAVPEGHHLALQIELTLGAGTFATMALREVLKTRTGSAHQKDLTEKMEERIRGEDKVKEEAAADPVAVEKMDVEVAAPVVLEATGEQEDRARSVPQLHPGTLLWSPLSLKITTSISRALHRLPSTLELERRPAEARRDAERAMEDLGPDISALDALLDELKIPSRELASPGAPALRGRPTVPSTRSLRSSSLPQPDSHSHPSSTSPSSSPYLQPDAGTPSPATLSPPLRSSSFPTSGGLSASTSSTSSTSVASLGTFPHQHSSQYLSSTPPDPESDITYLRPPSVASFATTNSSSHHSPVPAPVPVTSTEETMEQTAAMIKQLYARLDVQGVPGDGWEPGQERSRDGLISPEIVAGGQTIGRGLRGLAMRESVLLPPDEVQVLKKVDRYGFFSSSSALASQHNRIATLRTEPLSVLPGESRKKSSTPSAPAQSAATLAHRASTASLPPVLSTFDLEREQRRISKWSDMLSVATRDEGGNTRLWAVDPAWWAGRTTGGGKYANLQRRVMKGIPDRWRGAVWGLMLEKMATEASAGQDLPSLDDLEAEYRRLLDVPSESDVQIDLDVPRTISGHIQFHTRYGQGQRALFHVLHALGLHCDGIGGYCQGMGPIAATLLCYFEPQASLLSHRAFASLVRLFDQYGLSQIFAPGFPGLLESFYVHERVVEFLMPEVHQAFTTHFISSSSYATKWYITLFANSVPFSTQLRLWDGFFCEGVAFIELTAVAVIWSFRDAFASPDAGFESILSKLSSFFLCDSDDTLMRWIRKVLRRKDLREKMEGWRHEWRGFVADGSSTSRTT